MSLSSLRSFLTRPELGLLLMRIGAGSLMILYGFNKFKGGEDVLRSIGSAVSNVGISVSEGSVLAMLFGIFAAGAELAGGALLLIGWLFRTACFFLLCTMIVATATKFGGGPTEFGFPLIMAVLFLSLSLTGPGNYSIQKV